MSNKSVNSNQSELEEVKVDRLRPLKNFIAGCITIFVWFLPAKGEWSTTVNSPHNDGYKKVVVMG